MKYDIARIKDSITITGLLNRRGYDIGTGKRMIKSPLRDEKTASFSIRDNGRKFHDFGSGKDGDIIDLEMELTGCSKADAIRNLAAFAGVAGEDGGYDDLPPIPPPPKHHVARKLGDMIPKEQARLLRHTLKLALEERTKPSCCQTLAWLRPEDRQRVLKKGFLGADTRGRLVYIMRRGLKVRTDPSASRGDRWITGKAADNALFSWQPDDLKSGGPKTVLFTEGESDAMAATARWDGQVRIVGCMGSCCAPPMEILYAVARDCDRAVIAFDGDEAGRTGSKNLVALLTRLFPHMTIVNYRTPDGQDIKKMYLSGDIAILDELLANNS